MITTPWYRYYTKYRSYFSNNLNKLKKKDELKAYLELMLSLITVIIFSVFALKPTLVTIALLFKDIRYKEDVIQKMDVKIDNLKKAQDLLTRESVKISYVYEAIPISPEPETLIRQMEGISQTKGLPLSFLNLGSAGLKGTVNPTSNLILNLSFSSDFSDTLDFTKALETLRRQIVITRIYMNSEQQKGTSDFQLVSGIEGYSQFSPQ